MRIPKRLIQAIADDQSAVFIGSGLSSRLFNRLGKRYPGWAELIRNLNEWSLQNDLVNPSEHAMIDDIIAKNNLTMAAQVLRNKATATDFGTFLESVFRNDNRFDYVHSQILDIPFSFIVTTNYDSIIESAYSNKYNETLPTFTPGQIGMVNHYIDNRKRFLFKIHGTYERGDTVVLAESDYRLLYHTRGYMELMNKVFLSKSVLFVGFGYNDPAIRDIIENLSFAFDGNNRMHYLLMEKGRYNNLEQEFLKENDRVTVIEYENEDGTHSQIETFFRQIIDEIDGKKK